MIRPAGAMPTGVRTSPSVAANPAQAAAAQVAAQQAAAKPSVKAKSKAKAKGKARKPAVPRRPLSERLRERMQGLRFRVLPVTIFVAVLMLGVRVGDVWRVATRDARFPDFPATMAQGQGTTTATPTQVAASTPKTSPPQSPVAQAPSPGGSSNGPAPAASPPPDNPALGPVKNEELLQHFADRRAEIERRTKEVEQREALLSAAEKRIDQKVQELDKVRSDIQKLMRQGDEKQAAQLESLVKIYETMKPKEAARIFEELDMSVLLGVIERMKETKTAPILAAMDPVKAKEVTSALVERRGLPSSPK
ncbi:MotE family protein [Azospirillum sp. sgz302134]